MKRDIHQEITDSVIAAIESGTMPWETGRVGGFNGLPRRSTGEYYNGINIVILWMAAADNGFSADQWFTYKQAQALGAQVRKGEKGTPVVYYSTIEKEVEGRDDPDVIPFLKSYTVFNAQQIDGLPEKYIQPDLLTDTGARPIAELQAFFDATGAKIIDGASPSYNLLADIIEMPPVHKYHDPLRYYSTLGHELVHWTGHKSRLERLKPAAFGSKDYAFEELIAELGSAFLNAQIGGLPTIDNHAAYIEQWLQALRNDKKFIFKAAAAASKAVGYINSLQTAKPLSQAA